MGCGIVRDMVISEEAEYRLFSDDIESASKQRVEKVDDRFTLATVISNTGNNNATLAKTQGRIGVCSKSSTFHIINWSCSIILHACLCFSPTEILSRKENP